MARKNVNPWGGTFTDDDFGNEIRGSWYNDTIFAHGGDDDVFGDDGDDKVYGGDGDDALHGGDGNDKLYGQDDNDAVFGGAGDDIVDGGNGNDILDGGSGSDTLRGGADDDRLNDWTGSGSDEIDGGTGHDTLSYAGFEGKTEVTLNGDAEGSARQWVKMALFSGGPQTWVELGADEIFSIEDVIGGSGDDTITGDGNANDFYGNVGNDKLFGKGGNDVLDGSYGNDIIDGGTGYDIMTGGIGADTFVFKNGETTLMQFGFFGRTPNLIDTITDYTRDDKIDLSNIDANTLAAGDQAFRINPVARFTGNAGELQISVEFGATENVYLVEGDVNGDARADFMIEVHGQISGIPEFIL
jgi:Ca2+-binding RTX toxin-like protein